MGNSSSELIETRTEKIWISDGIILCKAKAVEKHGLDDAKENVKATYKLSNGLGHLLLVDIRDAREVSIKARKYYISEENKNVIACAFIIDSPLSVIIGRMFMGMNKPVFPVRLFSNRDKAIAWLRSHRS